MTKATDLYAGVNQHAERIEQLALEVWKYSELSLLEEKSSALLQKELKDTGFTITVEGAGGVPTAFVAEYGSGGPVLGIMAEYDALPGLGNAAVPRKQDREDGVDTGHGCGHNLIGAGAVGAALVLKEKMEAEDVSGTLRVYGAAAEETEGAKVFMARAGLFDDVDAFLHWHPLDQATLWYSRSAAVQMLHIEFKGLTAHAGLEPWKGRSALDAAELFLHAVNLMREHVEPTARLQYVITNGGLAPNVVPDFASVLLYYRDVDRKHVDASVTWLKQAAEGAAMATQTKGVAIDYMGMHDLLPNDVLAACTQSHLEAVGLPDYTDEEIAFAKEIQSAAGVDPVGMARSVIPKPAQPGTMGGSTDVGDASWKAPTMGPFFPTIPVGIGVHTWMATACHGHSLGVKGAVQAAKVLAGTGWDILTDADLRMKMKEEFDERTRDFTYRSPIPEMIREPSGLPEDKRKYGTVVELKEAIIKHAQDDAYSDAVQ